MNTSEAKRGMAFPDERGRPAHMTILQTALALHAAGCAPLPIRPDGSKAPAVPWAAYRTQAPTVDALHDWFGRLDTDGLGIVTGTASGNLEMLEVEGRAAHLLGEIAEHLAAHDLADIWARINAGWVEVTPGGGMHWHYRVTGGPARPNTKIARRPATPTELADNPAEKVKVLIETRGEGGFTVLAPSGGRTHRTGAPWTRVAGGPTTIPTITAEQRDALHAVLRLLDQMPTPEPAAPPTLPGHTTSGTRPGDDYDTRTTWDEILVPRGWTKGRKLGAGWAWTRPGKDPRDGISATTGTRGDGADRLYVFSTATEFDVEKPYGKFAAYALLEHGGDYTAAARTLSTAGYGARDTTGRHDLHDLVHPAPAATNTPQQPAQPPTDPDHTPATWARTDLTGWLDGTHTPTVPTLFPRADGVHLLYPGLTHSFHGESESGKSLLAQIETARLLAAGRPVLYVDCESDAAAIVERLQTLGATRDQILEHLDYRRPEVSPKSTTDELDAWEQMLAATYDLAVIDGVTDSLGMFGFSTKDNDEITTWMRVLPRNIANRTGAAVVVIDHVTKDAESRGRFAIGGQAKLAGLSGAAYAVEIAKPLGRGLRGEIVMRVAKDRPGHVRGHSAPMRHDRTQETARIVVDSTGPTIVATVNPSTGANLPAGSRPRLRLTGIMENISEILENEPNGMSLRTIRSLVTSNNERIAYAIADLAREQYISITEGPRKSTIHRSIRPYRQRQDPQSDLFDPLTTTGQNGTIATVPDRARPCPGHGEVTVPTVPLPVGAQCTVTVASGPVTVPRPNNVTPLDPHQRAARGGHLINLTTGEIIDNPAAGDVP